MSKLRQLYKEFEEVLRGDEEIERMADTRIGICEKCDDEDNGVMYVMKKATIKGQKVDLFEQPFCRACTCFIFNITHTPDRECPNGKFKKFVTV